MNLDFLRKAPFDAGLAVPAGRRFSVTMSVEALALLASLYFSLVANRAFLRAALQDRAWTDPSAFGFGSVLLLLLVALHFVLFAAVLNRWIAKPLLAVLIVATAFATFFMQRFGVYLDPSMLRNVLHTDGHEARELMSWALAGHLFLYAVLPCWGLSRVRLTPRTWRRATLSRVAALLLASGLGVALLLAVFQPLSSLMRNHKELRYLITPANYVWSLGRVLTADAQGAARARLPIGLDAVPGASWATRSKPRLVVLVVGETARAANWGLNGSARQTTPELARLPVINFSQVSSCGTNTEVSLPCMFAPVGRRQYDEDRIRGSESLLHVVARAGVGVHWRDNQSGCKGVCEGLSTDSVASLNPPGLCADGRCLDEGLLSDLDVRLDKATGTQLLVLHQIGNHGPSYFRRYPRAFERFQPACRQDDLQRCSREEITNAYDNALLYTDHVLATLIQRLQARAGALDSAVLYVSDHGESLGEHNLYLHGVPYAIAPSEQTRVPMVMWLSSGFQVQSGINTACLRQHAADPVSHDHVFHSLLALLDVRTSLYEANWDLTRACRLPAASAALP